MTASKNKRSPHEDLERFIDDLDKNDGPVKHSDMY